LQTYFFTGKGGTGKTTISSALARELSGVGYNTLLVSLDPAHNLQDIFELEESGPESQITENLRIIEPDFEKIKTEYFEGKVKFLRETTSHLSSFNIENYLDTLKYAPGQEEYAVMLFLRNLLFQRNKQPYQFIIFDTPPTGLLLKILSLPKLSLQWIRKLVELRAKIVDRREMISNIRNEDEKTKYYQKDQVLQQLRQQENEYDKLREFYGSANFYIVMNPDILVEKETYRLKNNLFELDFEIDGIINNRCNKPYTFEYLNEKENNIIRIGAKENNGSRKYQLDLNLIKKLDISLSE